MTSKWKLATMISVSSFPRLKLETCELPRAVNNLWGGTWRSTTKFPVSQVSAWTVSVSGKAQCLHDTLALNCCSNVALFLSTPVKGGRELRRSAVAGPTWYSGPLTKTLLSYYLHYSISVWNSILRCHGIAEKTFLYRPFLFCLGLCMVRVCTNSSMAMSSRVACTKVLLLRSMKSSKAIGLNQLISIVLGKHKILQVKCIFA